MSRIKKIRQVVAAHEADAAILSFLPDIRWASGFTGSNGLLIVGRDAVHLITDGRYTAQAAKEVSGATVHIASNGLYEAIALTEVPAQGSRIIVQSDHLTLEEFEQLGGRYAEVEWLHVPELLVRDVAQKDADEVASIRKAQRITDEVFEAILLSIRPGVTEKEIATEITYQHLKRGAERMSFEPIVASGPNGALPHARPTDRKLRTGDLVVLDFGCYLSGYASDMTRTVAIGEPAQEERQVYNIVLQAQRTAIEQAQAGMQSNHLDAVARDVITAAGYEEYFTHGLGHGVGLQIHEWPRVSFRVDYTLPEGAVVTIEPGVYLPERFGIRIEDMVVLRKGGCENLTSASKELIVL